jgi:hypothetical protein
MAGATRHVYEAVLYCTVLYTVYYNTSVPLFQVRPPGYFTHISISTPIVTALKNYYV